MVKLAALMMSEGEKKFRFTRVLLNASFELNYAEWFCRLLTQYTTLVFVCFLSVVLFVWLNKGGIKRGLDPRTSVIMFYSLSNFSSASLQK